MLTCSFRRTLAVTSGSGRIYLIERGPRRTGLHPCGLDQLNTYLISETKGKCILVSLLRCTRSDLFHFFLIAMLSRNKILVRIHIYKIFCICYYNKF